MRGKEPAVEAVVAEEPPAEAAFAEAATETDESSEEPAATAQSSWYVARGQGEPAWDGGPYAWEELLALAGEGALSGREFIWYESSQKWVTVAEVPGLMPRAATDAAPRGGRRDPGRR